MSNIYEQLKAKFDSLSFGFSGGPEGEDISLIKSMYSEEDALYALELTTKKFESAAELAARMGKDEKEVYEKLDKMSMAGLIFFKRYGEEKRFRFMPYLFGVLEFTYNKPQDPMSKGKLLRGDFQRLMWANETPLFHYIPVNADLVSDTLVLPREDAMQIIDMKDPDHIAIMVCSCRYTAKNRGNPCTHEGFEESCMFFDEFADYFVERGDARYITREYAKEILRKAEAEGLLIETIADEASAIECICMCCSCCCGPLRMLKTHIATNEAIHMASNYYIEINEGSCVHCSACVPRCPMEALKMVDGCRVHYPDRCLGCGLCVSVCPTEAIALKRKSGDKINPLDSKDVYELHSRIATERAARLAEEKT